MSTVAVKKEISAKWLSEFDLLTGKLGAANAVVKNKQQKAIETFSERGIPDKKTEDFKYSNMRLYLNDEFTAMGDTPCVKTADIKHLFVDGFATAVLVNGRFVAELSHLENLPGEITVKSLFTALKENNKVAINQFATQKFDHSSDTLVLLNTALACDGLFINVAGGFNCEVPIHILNISTGNKKALLSPRNLIRVEEFASLTLAESYHSINLTEKVFTNSVTEVVVEKEASFKNYMLQDEDVNARQNNVHEITVGDASRYNSTVVSVNGGMVRNDLNVNINGENAELHMHGLFIVKDGHHIDNHTLVEHNVPNCFSNELYKGIMSDGGTGVFNGKIYVHQDAQKTNAYQSNKNILLGDKAVINTKPQLEIYADDVRCTHGTSTGRIDEDALFYMQTRGLDENLARKVLLKAFTGEISDTIKDNAFREYIEQIIQGHIA